MISNEHHNNIDEWKDRYVKKNEWYDNVCHKLMAAEIRNKELETRNIMLERILNEYIHPEKEDTKYIFYRGKCYEVSSNSLDIEPGAPEELKVLALSVPHSNL